MAGLLIAFACIALFDNTLGLVALGGKSGYGLGWWTDGPLPITAGVVIAVALTALFIAGFARLGGGLR